MATFDSPNSASRPESSERFRPKLGRSTIVTGGIRLGSIALSFLFFVALARATSAETFGVFSFIFAMTMILGYFANIGQHVAILRFWPAIEDRYGSAVADKMLGTSMQLVAIGSSLTALAVSAFGLNSYAVSAAGGDAKVLFLAGVLTLTFVLAEFAAGALRAKGHIVAALAPRDIIWRVLVIISTLILPGPLSAPQVLGLISILLALACMPQFIMLGRDVWRHRSAMLPAAEYEKLRKATPVLWASTSTTPVMEHAATVVVGLALGPTAAGAYFAADRLAKLLLVALTSVEQVVAPQISRSYHAGDIELTKKIVSNASVIAFGVAILGAICYVTMGRFALYIFDPSYIFAYPILLTLVIGQLFNTLCGTNAMLLNMAGKERPLLAIRIVGGGLAVGLGFVGAITFGVWGAAVASTIVLIGWNISAVLVCRYTLGIWTIFLFEPPQGMGSWLRNNFVRKRWK
ncbi:putative Polysaccharide biosynthesis protein [uncultured Pleomorphomonas sp.]|uniref:Putative Polysaccharide biosynthesis protein n=1 Tax=uncultured Pleomorphomonas sp. TaxID=442121 RepID=A0A212LJD4_9HYPH|nr:oligosaccharide flippase family protein [uncultured Pleomorphomonas sp.]SCM77654.1 putative Polysaccharide biosynthesis protein [uncultured Pleomorphomonas sp.]